MVRVTGAKYLAWEDAFEVDFEDGLTFLEPHETIRKANRISPDAKPVRVELDEEPCIGLFVRAKHTLLAGIFRWEKPDVLQDCRCIVQQTAAPSRATMEALHGLRLESRTFVRLPLHRRK